MKPERRNPSFSVAASLGAVLITALALTSAAVAQSERPPDKPGGTPGVRPALPSRSGAAPAARESSSRESDSSSKRASAKPIGGNASAGAATPGTAPKTIQQIADRNGLVSYDRFIKLMADRFGALDKQKTGALPVEDVRKMLGEAAAK